MANHLDGSEGVLEVQGVGISIYSAKLHHLQRTVIMELFSLGRSYLLA